MFGLTGLVLGPVLASLFLSAWQLFGGVNTKADFEQQKEETEPRLDTTQDDAT